MCKRTLRAQENGDFSNSATIIGLRDYTVQYSSRCRLQENRVTAKYFLKYTYASDMTDE